MLFFAKVCYFRVELNDLLDTLDGDTRALSRRAEVGTYLA